MKKCPKCGSESFCVTAHVIQDWVVDGNGNFISSNDDCVEVTHFPDDSDIWDCNDCGFSAEGSAFNLPDFLAGPSWNPVLNAIVNLKHEHMNIFPMDDIWSCGEYENVISCWSDKLYKADFTSEYKKLFEPLKISQLGKLVLIKYDLLDTYPGFWNIYRGFYRECRSVVLDLENEDLVLTPFKKFFNLNEVEETQECKIREMINNSKSLEVSDKLDGSMISARYYMGKIVVSSSGSLNRETSLHCDLGYELLTESHRELICSEPDYTFIFELISPRDTHVVVYNENKEGLYLIGARDTLRGDEARYDTVISVAETFGVPHTVVFDKTFDELLNSLDEKKSNEAEGFVLNIDGYKLKLKYNDYVTIHRMLSKLVSTNTIIKAIDEGTWDDIRSKLPEAYRVEAEKVAWTILRYVDIMSSRVKSYYFDAKLCYDENEDIKKDRKNYYDYINKNCPSDIISYLIARYNSETYSFLRSKAGKYMKYYQIEERLKAFEAEGSETT